MMRRYVPPSQEELDKEKAEATGPDGKPRADAVCSGVVISERGDFLTNLHVIRSTDRWEVTFWDGSKSDAILVSMQPENDLAVIRPRRQPDDLKPATMASTADLNPGDMVVARSESTIEARFCQKKPENRRMVRPSFSTAF